MKRLLQAIVMLALSSSCLLASLTQPPQSKQNSTSDATSNPCPYPMGTADDPVKVDEYVAFLKVNYAAGTKELSYYESFWPDYYANLYAEDADPAYNLGCLMNITSGSSDTIATAAAVVAFSYSYTVDSKKVSYDFSYAANNGNGDQIIKSVSSQQIADAFNNARKPTAQKIYQYINDFIQDFYGKLSYPSWGEKDTALLMQDAAAVKSSYPGAKQIFDGADQLVTVLLCQSSRFVFADNASINAGKEDHVSSHGSDVTTLTSLVSLLIFPIADCDGAKGDKLTCVAVIPGEEDYRPDYITTTGINDCSPQENTIDQVHKPALVLNYPYIISNQWPTTEL